MRISSSQLPRLATHVAALLALTSAPGAAQVAADSASRAKAADTAAAGYGDSARQAGVDTSGDRATPDSLKTAQPSGNPSAEAPVAAPAVPADSILSAVCLSAPPGTVAPGLLLVLFRDSATDKERAAALTGSGGITTGQAPAGGVYVRPAADTISSRDLADRLVQDPSVASISERTCPAGK